MGFLLKSFPFGTPGPYVVPGDLQITEPYPKLVQNGTETNGQWTERVEIAGSIWVATNATYSGSWSQVDPSKISTAFVLPAGGGIATYSSPAGTNPVVWTSLFAVNAAGLVTSGGGLAAGAALANIGAAGITAFYLVAGAAASNLGSRGITSSLLARADALAQIGWFSVDDYASAKTSGVIRDGTDDSPAVNAAITACFNAGGGTVWFNRGTYLVQNIATPASTTVSIYLTGAGMYATTLLAFASCAQVIQLTGNGAIANMTVDGNALATNGAVHSTASTNVLQRTEFINVRARNIVPGNAGWVMVTLSSGGSTTVIAETLWQNCIIEGPSATGQDACAIANVDTSYVNNLIIRNVSRSPNFYLGNRVFISGMVVSNVTSLAAFVCDAPMNECYLANVRTDGTSPKPQLNCPKVVVTNCSFDNGVTIGNIGQTLTQDVRLANSRIETIQLNPVVGSPTLFSVQGCEFVPLAGQVAAILDNHANPTTLSNWHIVGNRFDTTLVTSFVTAFNGGLTLTSSQFSNNKHTGPVTFGATTLAGSVHFRNNDGINPKGALGTATGASPLTLTNNFGVDVTYYVAGGTVSSITVDGQATGLTSGPFRVPVEKTMTITYTAGPTINVVGD